MRLLCHELKYAGFDGIVVEGKSEIPVYVHVRDGDVEGVYNATGPNPVRNAEFMKALRTFFARPGRHRLLRAWCTSVAS